MNKIALVVAVAALLLAGSAYIFIKQNPSVGATPGGDFLNLVNFQAGSYSSGQVATSSTGSSITVSANDFKGWTTASVVSISQGLLADQTFTFPASSTLSSIVPRAGDRAKFCIRNATTTANLGVILAGSTGVNLLVASSSVSALGGKLIKTGKVGCVELVREAPTTTTFDIDALLTVFN